MIFISIFSYTVATPKLIRELMKVDGLTNDEVKSHLQVRNKKQSTEIYTKKLVLQGAKNKNKKAKNKKPRLFATNQNVIR